MTLSKSTQRLMEELTQAFGIPGDEKEVSRILLKHYSEFADEVIYDHLGSIFAVKKSRNKDAKTIMIAAHMDEVGFIVSKITANGMIGFTAVGGWWSQTLLGQRVLLKSKSGKNLKGAIGSIPPHLLNEKDRKSPMEIKHMLIDVGQTSKAAVEALGIMIGSSIILEGSFEVLEGGNRLLSKAWDNRYGCIMGVEILRALKAIELDVNLVVGATVQEEVGVRGAQTSTTLIKPDAAIVFDCSPANDASGDPGSFGQLGKGPLVRFIDANYLPHRGFLYHYIDVLETNGLPYQYYQSLGGTDAGAIHKSYEGVMTLTMCICARNIHTNSSIIDVSDYETAKKAALALIRTLTPNTIEALKKVIQ